MPPFSFMNKAFTKESEDDEEEGAPSAPALPAGTRNYMTRRGFDMLKHELDQLLKVERPNVT